MDLQGKNLTTLISGPVINNDQEIASLLTDVNDRKDIIFYVPNACERKLEFISTPCETKLGYSVQQFLSGGLDFFFHITEQKTIPKLIEKQVAYTRQSRTPGPQEYNYTGVSNYHQYKMG